MTVAELIAALQKLPSDAVVKVFAYYGNNDGPIEADRAVLQDKDGGDGSVFIM